MAEKEIVDLSVIIPVYNEANILSELCDRLHESVGKITANYELIFVNDGSADHTLTTLLSASRSNNKIKFISFSRNFGHQIAVTAGLDHCSGEVIVIMDGDLQDPPEVIPKLYEKYREGYEVVYAKRTVRKGESVLKKVTAKLFYRLLKRITSFEIPLDTGDFRLIDKKIVNYLRQMPEQNKFLRGQIAWLGFRQSFVEFERDKRRAGKTGYSLSKMIAFAIDGITAFSDKPLKFVTNMGILVSSIAFLVIIYSLVSHFILDRTISGWTSLIISVTFFGGIQLISTGIIGEYISRINKDIRDRPLYIIDKTNINKTG